MYIVIIIIFFFLFYSYKPYFYRYKQLFHLQILKTELCLDNIRIKNTKNFNIFFLFPRKSKVLNNFIYFFVNFRQMKKRMATISKNFQRFWKNMTKYSEEVC